MKIFSIALLLLFATNLVKDQLTTKWKLVAIEEFGSKWDVADKNKDDFMELKKDGTYEMKFYGELKSGNWSYNNKGKSIHFVNGEEKLFFKIKSNTATKLLAEYQHPSLIRSLLHFERVDEK